MARTTNPRPEQQPEKEELVLFLEPDQLTADTSIPVARAHLNNRTNTLLWALRIFSILLSGMVIYTFAAQLH
jgi:hypothetical protein